MGSAAYKQRHREQGLCLYCSEPRFPGLVLCAEHNHTNKLSVLTWKQKNRAHLSAYRRNYIKKMIAEGRCRTCGNDLDSDADYGCRVCMNCRSQEFRRLIRCR